jgi:phospholipase DDHD2
MQVNCLYVLIIISGNKNNKSDFIKYEIRTLKRGLPDRFFDEITPGDKDSVQHLCFVVHGIGSACDMKFRSLVECVEDFRQTSRTILQSHFKSYVENGDIHRVVCRKF